MRIAYLGTPQEAVEPLRALVAAGHEIVLVVTQADKRRGRGGALSPSPVKAAAQELFLPVSHRVKDILDTDAEVGVVVAFGRLLKPVVLDHMTFLNLHPSLLPRWRGATPIESAILAGDARSGVCVMKLEEEMDAGPIYAMAETDVFDDETADELSHRLFALGTVLLLEQLQQGLSEPTAQVGEPTFAQKISPEDLHLSWQQPAEQLARITRIGRGWTTFRGKRLLVLKTRAVSKTVDGNPGTLEGTVVATGQGALELVTVQPEGKGPQSAQAWVNGARPEPREQLT